MTTSSAARRAPVRVFDDDAVREVTARYRSLPEAAHPALHAAAADPAREPFRRWLDAEVERLRTQDRDEVIGRLRDENLHSSAVSELAALAVLRDGAGLDVTYEAPLEDLTPDLLASAPGGGEPVLVAEVWTRCVPPEAIKETRGWAELRRDVGRLPGCHLLKVSDRGPGPATPPGRVVRDRIVAHLRRHLPQSPQPLGWTITTNGLTFETIGWTGQGTQLAPATASTSLDRGHVVRAIEDKVARYRHALENTGVPFMVVLAAEERTGLDEAFVSAVLGGRHPLTINFNLGVVGSMIPRKQTLRRTASPPRFDPALSAVAFLDVRNGHDAELVIWPVASARHPMPTLAASPCIRVLADAS